MECIRQCTIAYIPGDPQIVQLRDVTATTLTLHGSSTIAIKFETLLQCSSPYVDAAHSWHQLNSLAQSVLIRYVLPLIHHDRAV